VEKDTIEDYYSNFKRKSVW